MDTIVKLFKEGFPQQEETLFSIPAGIPGFEDNEQYSLMSANTEDPMMWLEMLARSHHGFLVVSPADVVPNYAPDISQQDVEFLGIQDFTDAFVINIATLRDSEIFVNLQAPIVVNRHTLIGRQCVPTNVWEFTAAHPLSLLANAA